MVCTACVPVLGLGVDAGRDGVVVAYARVVTVSEGGALVTTGSGAGLGAGVGGGDGLGVGGIVGAGVGEGV